jgi:cytochrome c biogenesis protein CcmG/thiol:disulfide interchange protein DsbE
MNESESFPSESVSTGPRWGRIAAWVLVIGLLAVVAIQLRKAQEGTVQLNRPVPEFSFTTFEGIEYTPADMHGKVVLVNFWASWCLPCEEEAAELQQAWEMYEPTGEVLFVGLAWTDTDAGAAAYLQRFGITYPNGHDLGTRISQAFRTRGVPETYVIDPDGNLSSVQIGPYPSVEHITAAIERALGN